MNDVAKIIVDCFKNGGKVLTIGNGGSCEMASHFAAEMLCKFEKERKPLPAIALTNPAVITAIANDFSFKYIYSRQIEALGNKEDILLIFTTSRHLFVSADPKIYEHSENIAHAINEAKKKDMIILFVPRNGNKTSDIQESQLRWIHEVSRIIEKSF